jgi:hypothetical protein
LPGAADLLTGTPAAPPTTEPASADGLLTLVARRAVCRAQLPAWELVKAWEQDDRLAATVDVVMQRKAVSVQRRQGYSVWRRRPEA